MNEDERIRAAEQRVKDAEKAYETSRLVNRLGETRQHYYNELQLRREELAAIRRGEIV